LGQSPPAAIANAERFRATAIRRIKIPPALCMPRIIAEGYLPKEEFFVLNTSSDVTCDESSVEEQFML
jgi:hypothetical protein